MTPQEQVLLDALAPWVDTHPLRALLDAPTRIVLLGRTGVGKTSLINRMTGQARPVGLGGVTRAIEPVPDGSVTWIDTPGIDDPWASIDRLGPVCDDADAVLWVVDGLQPLTHTERQVLDAIWSGPLDVVVSRADLVADELDSVRARVVGQTQHRGPDRVFTHDLRPSGTLVGSSDSTTMRRVRRGPARRSRLREALGTARTAFEGLPVPVHPDRLTSAVALRAAVNARTQRLLQDPEATPIPELVVQVRQSLEDVRHARVVELAADPALAPYIRRLPELPEVPDPGETVMETLRLGVAGRSAVGLELKGLAARWTVEAELVLAEWAESIRTDAAGAEAWQRAARALATAPLLSDA